MARNYTTNKRTKSIKQSLKHKQFFISFDKDAEPMMGIKAKALETLSKFVG